MQQKVAGEKSDDDKQKALDLPEKIDWLIVKGQLITNKKSGD